MAIELSRSQRRYLVHNQLIPAIAINFLINLFFGWHFFHRVPTVHLLQAIGTDLLPNSIALDLVPTTFFLVFFTGLVVSCQIRRLIQSGKMDRLHTTIPRSDLYRLHRPVASFRAATLTTMLLVLSTVALLYWSDMREVPVWDFIWFKALYAAALAALFTPMIIVLALADAPGPGSPRCFVRDTPGRSGR